MNPTHLGRLAQVTTTETDEFPADCEHCGWIGNPVVAEIYWEPWQTTSPGFTLACPRCIDDVVDGAIETSAPGSTIRVVLLVFVPDCDIIDLALFGPDRRLVAAS